MLPRLVVSVAMCTYNGAAYVAEQLKSILSGTARPDEIVVVDDGSSDDTVAIVRDLLAVDGLEHRVEVNDVGLGVTKNFERATSLCRGDLIVLSDQDDRWHAERLEAAIVRFRADPGLLLVHGDAHVVDGGLKDSGYLLFRSLDAAPADLDAIEDGRGFSVHLRRNLATGATMAFRRSLLEAARPFPGDWVHDEWLAIIASTQGRIGVERRALIDYRQHGANQIGVARLSLRDKVNRVTAPEPGRIDALARRGRTLVDRLEGLGVGAPFLIEARGKEAFEKRRAELSASRLWRAPQVLREVARGDYRRYASRGRLDILRDVFQPRDRGDLGTH